MALLLLGLVVMGLYMTGLPFSPQRLRLFNWHKWAGITALALAALRLAWRLARPAPALPAPVAAAMPGWQRRAHQGVHAALYGLLFAIPLLGWAYSSATGMPVVVFGVLPLPDLAPVDKALAATLKQAHHLAAYALVALVALHVGAALKHHFIHRDGLLGRMGFGPR
jgi:cytochrome b561